MTSAQMSVLASYFTSLADNEGFVMTDAERAALSAEYDLSLIRRLFDRIHCCYVKRDNILGLRTVPKHLDRKNIDSLIPEEHLRMYYKHKDLWPLQQRDVDAELQSSESSSSEDDDEDLVAELQRRLQRIDKELRELDDVDTDDEVA